MTGPYMSNTARDGLCQTVGATAQQPAIWRNRPRGASPPLVLVGTAHDTEDVPAEPGTTVIGRLSIGVVGGGAARAGDTGTTG